MDLSLDQALAFVDRARQYDMKVAVSDPDSGSNASEDRFVDVLTSTPDDPVLRELRGFLAALTVDQQAELVALAWIGRGDFEAEEFDEAVALAHDRSGDRGVARYLLGIPNIGDLVNEGLAAIGEDTFFVGDMTTSPKAGLDGAGG